jgi:hypothetical protein
VYRKEWFGRALRDTYGQFTPWSVKLGPAFLTPLLLYKQFLMGSMTDLSAIWKVALCLIESYTLVFVAIFMWKLFQSVPLLLGERDAKILSSEQEIAKLNAVLVAPKFRTELKTVGLIYRPHQQTTFHATVNIRNISGEQTTLHDLTLSCVRGPAIVLTNPDRRYLLPPAEPLEHGTSREGNLVFMVHTPMQPEEVEALKGTQWQFAFKDIRGQRYGSDICELSYP